MGWNLIGHTWAAELLQQQIAADRMRHAYLFTGPPGVGRRTLALNFARAINCASPTSPGVPCGVCRTCVQISRMQHADLTITQSEAEGDSLKVDQIRDLQHSLSLAPYESAYRIALLIRFNEATDGAQNAFLKTLEEPNERVVLLVSADEPENLLPTIVSRCELLRLRPLPFDELEHALIEKKNIEPQKARLIAHIAGGRPGYAIRLVDDESLLTTRQEWLGDLLSLVNAPRRDRLSFSESKSRGRERAETRQALRQGLAHWLSFWRDVLLLVAESSTELANLDYSDQIRSLASQTDKKRASGAVAHLEHAFARLPNANLQLLLDSLLLEWPSI